MRSISTLRGAIFALLFIIVNYQANSQAQRGHCGTDYVRDQLVAQHPEMLNKWNELEDFTNKFYQNSKDKSMVTYVIPVVVHIFHDNGIGNIPDANVHNMLGIVNEDFQGKQADSVGIAPAFQSIFGGFDVEFRLATKDPNGNCTNGINRVNDPVYTYQGGCINGNCTGGAPIQWPPDKYLNIWVVNEIDVNGQFLGYAAFPSFPTFRQGVIIQNNVFGTLPPSSNNNFSGRYMSHEIGHIFNLCHVWACSGQNGAASNCTEDDGVSDTPNTVGTQNCNTSFSSCGSLDNVQNFMDYSYGACSSGLMFTDGQVNRMIASLNSSVGDRNNLWSPANLLATGTDDASFANPPVCIPIADFGSSKRKDCTGNDIQYFDRSFNANFNSNWTYSWQFQGGTPASSTDRNPIVTYSNPGEYDVSLTVTNSSGTSPVESKTDYIEALEGSGSFVGPYVDRISPDWPDNTDASLAYEVERPSGTIFDFDYTENAYFSPPGAIFLNNFGYNGTDNHSFFTPIMDFSNMVSGSTYLNFHVAHRKKANENEVVFLFVSTDCGSNWTLDRLILANSLISVSTPSTVSFTPADTSEWNFVSLDMSAYSGMPNVQFQFEFASAQGNNIFFDDIELSDVPEPAPLTSIGFDELRRVSIYPNPAKSKINIDFYTENVTDTKINVFDVLGRKIDPNQNINIESGYNSIEISLDQGIYIVQISNRENSISKRIIIE